MPHPYLNNPHPNFKDLREKRFGLLVVEDLALIDKRNGAKWICVCDCGFRKSIGANTLLMGGAKSCGCLEGFHRHGCHKTPEYHTWENIIQRCTNPKAPNFRHYGGRGIAVCECWINSFEAFREDMGLRPSPKHSIDRIDNNGDYTPENCRWATKLEQCSNTRRNHFITRDGETHTITEWARKLNIKPTTIHGRIARGNAPF